MYHSLREWNIDVVLLKFLENTHPDLSFDVFGPKNIIRPKKHLEN